MNEDHMAPSSGKPNAQPPTPTSATFPTTPLFETPRPFQGPFGDAGGLTPCFAEEFSVFSNAPPDTQDSFASFLANPHASSSLGHNSLAPAGGIPAGVVAHAYQISPSNFHGFSIPPVAPAHRLPSSPDPSCVQHNTAATSQAFPLSPNLTETSATSSGKTQRDRIAELGATQEISPPLTVRKGKRKLAPKHTMPHDHEPAISDLHDPLQQDMMAFLGDYGNMFDYPMSTPVVAQPNLWDHPLPMDLGVMAAPEQNHFQLPPSSTHRHSGSFDWNSETQLFQNVNSPPSNQENIQPTTMTGAPAPKLLMSDAGRGSNVDASMRIPSSLPSDDPFITGGDAVDPGLLCSRPQSAATDAGHGGAIRPGSVGVSALEADKAQGSKTRGPSGKKRTRKTTKGPERSSPCLPHKASKRPALGRSASDSRASRPRGRNLLPSLAPASNPAHGTGHAASAAASRLSGRTSPLRSQQRLSSLTRVPEKTPRFHPQASVELTVDAFGRAHAKTTLPRGGTLARSQSSQDMSRNRDWSMADADDSDDTDYEPIIIPSRQTSFTASFALRDPREPVGSIFHSSGQDQAARSSSGSINGGESDAETVMAHERSGDNGDAASEIRKVMSYRRRGMLQQRDGRTQRYLSINPCNFPGGIISPTSLTDSSFGTDVCSVRCYCNNGSYDESEGCMVKCGMCEMWLHGRCTGITRRTMKDVYICKFCVHTPDVVRRRINASDRENALGIATVVSPLAAKAIRSFR